MDHMSHHGGGGGGHEGMGVSCDGVPPKGEGGTLMGHVLPGILFVVWGSWWAYNVCLRSVVSVRNKMVFESQPFYRFPRERMSLLEPVLKIVLPIIAMSMELYFDHLSEGFQHLYCPEGTIHAGEFAGDNVNNWQHASSYPAVITSGIVDLLSRVVKLPPGVNRAFSALWIGIMGFLMFVHEKHEALDKMVHWLLAVAMLFAFVCAMLEVYATKSPVVSMSKSVTTILVGAWLIQIGKAMYAGGPEWTQSRSVGAMLAPVFFCMILLLIAVSVLGLYVILSVLHAHQLIPKALLSTCEAEHQCLPRHTNLASLTDKGVLELAERKHLLQSEESFDNDSALCPSEHSPKHGCVARAGTRMSLVPRHDSPV